MRFGRENAAFSPNFIWQIFVSKNFRIFPIHKSMRTFVIFGQFCHGKRRRPDLKIGVRKEKVCKLKKSIYPLYMAAPIFLSKDLTGFCVEPPPELTYVV